MKTHYKISLLSVSAALLLSSCGGGGSGDSQGSLRKYSGEVSGPGCVAAKAETATLSIVLAIDAFEPGGSILVEDASGMQWTGTMLSSSSFEANSQTDGREQISGTNMTPTNLDVTLDTCLVTNCCVTLTGQLLR